jgi:hypothetical protein
MPRRRRSVLTALLLLGLFTAPLAAARPSVELPAWGTEPSPPGTSDGVLNAISVGSATDIWAVGQHEVLYHRYSLTVHYDGSDWTVVPSPSMDGIHLEDVVTIGPNDAWAVGWLGNPSSLDSQNITMHWNGKAWSMVPVPQPGRTGVDQLYAVDAAGPNDVWAVGVWWDYSPGQHSVILHWDGIAWRVFGAAVDLGLEDATACHTYGGLRGVTVVSPSDVWAVGDSLTCHYDGRAWTEVPSPQPRPEHYEVGYPLEDVAAASPTDVWAVGARITDNGYYLDWNAFAEHWDGERWAPVFFLPVGQILLGVDAVSSNDIWAVGNDDYGPIIIHYDGDSWSHVPTPEANRGGRLAGVGSAAANDLWAAGNLYQAGVLIERAPSGTQGAVLGDTNVAFATVSWFGPENGSIETDSYGDFQVGGLLAGNYTFIASEPGCSPDSRAVTVVAGETQPVTLHISCPHFAGF